MLKTVRITSILITLAAIGLTITAVISPDSNADAKGLFSSPGVAEQLQASYSGKMSSETDRETPLMRQARAFALRIDPPPPPAPPAKPVGRTGEAPRPKVAVSAQFTLVGTSYKIDDSKNSWALLNEVGKGFHWVRTGDTVGHLKIEKIGNGSVLIRDGERVYEMNADKIEKPDLVKSYTGTIDAVSVPDIWQGVEKNEPKTPKTEPKIEVSQPNTPAAVSEVAQVVETPAPEPNAADVEANIEWLKQIKENPEALGMTAEEAKELEGLGDVLKTMEDELKQIKSEPNNVEKDKPDVNTPPASVNTNTADANQPQTPAVQKTDLRSKRAEMLRTKRRR